MPNSILHTHKQKNSFVLLPEILKEILKNLPENSLKLVLCVLSPQPIPFLSNLCRCKTVMLAFYANQNFIQLSAGQTLNLIRRIRIFLNYQFSGKLALVLLYIHIYVV